MANSQYLKVLDKENFASSTADGVVLVDFFAEWCGPCKMMAPILEEIAQELEGTATIAQIDVDGAQELATEFQVTSVPTLILFKNGSEVERVVGLKDKDTLKHLVTSAT